MRRGVRLILLWGVWWWAASVATAAVVQTTAAQLCAAIATAHSGDIVRVAGSARQSAACVVEQAQLTIEGSYSADFGAQRLSDWTWMEAPEFLIVKPSVERLTVSGIGVDAAAADTFGDTQCPGCFEAAFSTSRAPVVRLLGSGTLRWIHGGVVNAAFGVFAGTMRGSLDVRSSFFATVRGQVAAIEGECGYASAQCASVTFVHSTVMGLWPRTQNAADEVLVHLPKGGNAYAGPTNVWVGVRRLGDGLPELAPSAWAQASAFSAPETATYVDRVREAKGFGVRFPRGIPLLAGVRSSGMQLPVSWMPTETSAANTQDNSRENSSDVAATAEPKKSGRPARAASERSKPNRQKVVKAKKRSKNR